VGAGRHIFQSLVEIGGDVSRKKILIQLFLVKLLVYLRFVFFILLIFDNFANYLNKRYRKSRDTGNIGYTRHRIKINKAEKHSTKNFDSKLYCYKTTTPYLYRNLSND
jgi:hypothetical protein